MKSSPRGRWLAAVLVVAVVACSYADPPRGESPHDKTGAEWALHHVQRPALPSVRPGWSRNPIDVFVQAKLEAKGLTPNREADRLTLLKRVTHDLTGLAPTAEERDAFLKDGSPEAYENLVDRLLASPRFGERWAQRWLDLVRFSETDGYKVDRYRPDAWRYRDYVIRAFNDDLPYDRFVRQQIAGDELEPDNPDATIATGFLRCHPEETNGANYRKIRQDILDDITEVTGLAFMGMTVGCARCHDHKFDPITQNDYFEMQAFFAGVMPRDGSPLLRGDEAKDFATKLAAWEKATDAIRKELNEIADPVRKAMFDEGVVAIDDETQEALKCPEAQRSSMQMQLATLGFKQIARRYERVHRRLKGDVRKRYDELQTELAKFDDIKPKMPTAMAVTDAGPIPPPTYRLGGGDWRRPKREVRPDFPECMHEKDPIIAPPRGNPKTSGRRSAFANWLVDPSHPLTSRVIVNRLWQEYFGKGIVATPSDFGVAGERPTHPELIDFLASELMAKQWSLKAIHRLIVTSATYRQSSAPEQNPLAAAASKIDSSNKLLWHARVRRRDAEAIRDVALQASGSLNLRMFGAGALPELPPGVSDRREAWSPDANEVDRNRRSIYVFNCRNLTLPIFAAFDAPDRSLSCATRSSTVTAPQALLMLNSEFTAQQAKTLGGRLMSQSSDVRVVIREAYRRTLGREATDEDVSRGEFFIRQQAARIGTAAELPAVDAAIVDFCHALLNSAEFLNVE